MRFDVLGPLRVSDGERIIDISRQKERAVLAALLVDANSVVPLDRLVNQLWGDEPPARAVGTLHAYVSNLRRLLEPDRPPRAPAQVLVSRGPGYSIVVGTDELDAARFERLLREAGDAARAGDAAAALSLHDEALALWRGPAFADFPYDDFAAPAARRLEELRLIAVEGRMDALLACGRHDEVVAEAESRLLDDPLRERLWAQLVVALYRSGRQADALAACRRARAALDELGLEPGPALRGLEQAVLTQSPHLDAPVPAPAVPAAGRSESSPDDDTVVLAGRDEELAVIDAALDRLADRRGGALLLTGVGGIGKTALALEAARRAERRGALEAVGRCPESRAAPALWPWLQLIRQLDSAPLSSALADLNDAVQDGEPARHAHLMARVAESLRHNGDRPLVLVLDDVQWADELSHRLLQLTLTGLDDAPVLLVLTMRTPTHPDMALEETLATLRTGSRFEQLALDGLDEPATRLLVARVMGAAPRDDVVTAVQQRTDGNPFFTVELSRLLVAERRHEDAAVAAAAVPAGVRDVVRRRLTRLPDQVNAVLAVAAVVGPDIELRVVERIAGLDEDTLLDLFELAAVSGVLAERQDRPGVYRFAHDIVREAILESLPGMRRARLHERALAAVIDVQGDTTATAHELARHAVAAVPATGAAPAIRRLMASARVAIGDSALDHAERQVRIAAQLIDELPPGAERNSLEAHVHTRLGQIVFHTRADLAEAHARHRHALRMCAPDDIEMTGYVLMGIGCYGPLAGDFGAGVDAAERLLALAQSGHPNLLAAGHYLRAMCAWQGDFATALEHAELAVAASEAAGPAGTDVPIPIVRAHLGLVRALAADDRWRDDVMRAADEAVRDRTDWSLSWVGAFGAVAAVAADDRAACAEVVAAVRGPGAALGFTRPVIAAAAAWSTYAGPEVARAAADELARMHDGMFRPVVLTMLAQTLADGGHADDAAVARAEAAQAARAAGSLGWLTVVDRVTAAR